MLVVVVCLEVRPLVVVILVDGNAIDIVLGPQSPVSFLINAHFDLREVTFARIVIISNSVL